MPQEAAGAEPIGMPRGVRRALLGVVGLLLAGAAILVAFRGPAMLIDLGQAIGRVFCL